MADPQDSTPSQPPERLDQVIGGPLDPAADRPQAPPRRPSPLDPLSDAGGFDADADADAGGFDAGAFGGGGGGAFDLSSLFDSAQQLVAAQQEAAAREMIGRSGGGKVEIAVTGAGEFRRVTISADVVDPDDVSLLEDLVLAALHDAMAQVNDAQSSALGGFDLGQLGGLLGNG